MAGDWTKVENTTPEKPEIAILARKLGVSLGDAFLSWFKVYRWAGGITSGGNIPFLSGSQADELAGALSGTCAALASKEIGWISLGCNGSEGMTFKNWDRHNSKAAKARGLDALRKRGGAVKEPFVFLDTSGSEPEKNRDRAIGEQEESYRLLMGNRKAIGTTDSPLPVVPVAPRLPKDARDGERKALDLSGIDWSLVEATAEAIARKVPPLTPRDRRNWLRFAVMTQLEFSDDWLTDSIEAVVRAKESRKTKQAHLYGVLKAKAAELGLGHNFRAMLRDIEIPKEIWKSGVLGGSK